MQRRPVLRAGVGSLILPLSGCLGLPSGAPFWRPQVGDRLASRHVADDMTVEFLSVKSGSVIEDRPGGGKEVISRTDADADEIDYFALLTEEADVEENVGISGGRHDDVRTFIDHTDFEESYLLVLEGAGSSTPDLVPLWVGRTDRSLQGEVAYHTEDRSVTDDLTMHVLLLRITDAYEAPPDEVELSSGKTY